jgi:acetyl-CoA synthetase
MNTRHPLDNHAPMLAQFRWQVPRHFNIAEVCVRRWAHHSHTANRLAVITHHADAPAEQNSFAQIQAAADALSHLLAAQGVQAGDRVAVVLPQISIKRSPLNLPMGITQ